MPPSRKKVIVRRLTGDLLPGYLPPSAFVQQSPTGPTLDLLDLSSRSTPIPLDTVKLVSFVRDFNLDDTRNPERLTRTAFLARPRAEGLWLRLTFTTGDTIEGLAPLDTTLLDALIEDAGLFLTPPGSLGDARTNTHRLYIPRTAIATLQLLAVITTPSAKKTTKTTPQDQPNLFP